MGNTAKARHRRRTRGRRLCPSYRRGYRRLRRKLGEAQHEANRAKLERIYASVERRIEDIEEP